MADYRLECCGGFPSHTKECLARIKEREKAITDKKVLLDTLYARYGELVALTERSTTDHNKIVYANQADGLLMAIRIVEQRK